MAGRPSAISLVNAQALWPASPTHHAACSACTSDADPTAVYTGATDGSIVRWASPAPDHGLTPTMMLCGHTAPITAMSSAQHRLVSVDASGGVCVWDTVHHVGLHRSTRVHNTARTVAWLDGMLLFPGDANVLECVHPDTCQTLRTLTPTSSRRLHAIDCAARSDGGVCVRCPPTAAMHRLFPCRARRDCLSGTLHGGWAQPCAWRHSAWDAAHMGDGRAGRRRDQGRPRLCAYCLAQHSHMPHITRCTITPPNVTARTTTTHHLPGCC